MRMREEKDLDGLDIILKHITRDMEEAVKGCRMVVEETHSLAAVWKAQAVSVAAKSNPLASAAQPSVTSGFITEIPEGRSLLKTSSEPQTINLIHEFLSALSSLSCTIGEIEVYRAKRLYWANQFGGPINATLDEVSQMEF